MAMGEARQEPSMEDILASIKRIIAEDGNAAATAPRPAADADAADPAAARGFMPLHLVEQFQNELGDGPAEVLELTDTVESAVVPEAPAEPAAALQPAPAPAMTAAPAASIVSPDAALASRQSLAALSALVVKPEPGSDDTLQGLVREMLRPMLKEWLDQNLPEVVRELVEREIERISGRAL